MWKGYTQPIRIFIGAPPTTKNHYLKVLPHIINIMATDGTTRKGPQEVISQVRETGPKGRPLHGQESKGEIAASPLSRTIAERQLKKIGLEGDHKTLERILTALNSREFFTSVTLCAGQIFADFGAYPDLEILGFVPSLRTDYHPGTSHRAKLTIDTVPAPEGLTMKFSALSQSMQFLNGLEVTGEEFVELAEGSR